jgi:hypothetical protein
VVAFRLLVGFTLRGLDVTYETADRAPNLEYLNTVDTGIKVAY